MDPRVEQQASIKYGYKKKSEEETIWNEVDTKLRGVYRWRKKFFIRRFYAIKHRRTIVQN